MMPDETSVDQSTYEIVVFGLREGATHDQLVETDPGLSRWMQAQPGFVDRKLINVGEGNTSILSVGAPWKRRARLPSSPSRHPRVRQRLR